MASKMLALTFTVARIVILCHFLFNYVNCFSVSSGNRRPAVAEVVEEGEPVGPSRSELVRAWLREILAPARRASDRKRTAVFRQQAAADFSNDLQLPAYEDSLAAATYANSKHFRNAVRPQFTAESGRVDDDGDYDNLDLNSDWPASSRRTQTSRQMVSSSEDARFPIVFTKRNLCCSLDMYCTNCDDQMRKRNVRITRVY